MKYSTLNAIHDALMEMALASEREKDFAYDDCKLYEKKTRFKYTGWNTCGDERFKEVPGDKNEYRELYDKIQIYFEAKAECERYKDALHDFEMHNFN